MKTIKINTAQPYEILLGGGLLKNTGKILKNLGISGKTALITDDIVDSLYSAQVTESLQSCGFTVFRHVLPHGEKNKNLKNYSLILDFLAKNNLQRADTVIALGGGVIGDIGGFAAASYLRGIKYIQIPTTLLAVIDSSVGGKTGVNLKAGKNLAGAFHQPAAVIADTDTFKTLPEAEIKNGKGEMIKYGILTGGKLWDFIEKGEFLNENALELCINYKKYIVENDEKESGLRKMLNLGHTFGHAIEKLSKYTAAHGLSVATGIALIAGAENRKKQLSDASYKKIINLLKKEDMPITCSYNAAELIKAAKNDKKTEQNNITLVTIKDIGNCTLTKMPFSDFTRYLQ